MSADKYLSIFSRQMEAIVYLFILKQGLETVSTKIDLDFVDH